MEISEELKQNFYEIKLELDSLKCKYYLTYLVINDILLNTLILSWQSLRISKKIVMLLNFYMIQFKKIKFMEHSMNAFYISKKVFKKEMWNRVVYHQLQMQNLQKKQTLYYLPKHMSTNETFESSNIK